MSEAPPGQSHGRGSPEAGFWLIAPYPHACRVRFNMSFLPPLVMSNWTLALPDRCLTFSSISLSVCLSVPSACSSVRLSVYSPGLSVCVSACPAFPSVWLFVCPFCSLSSSLSCY